MTTKRTAGLSKTIGAFCFSFAVFRRNVLGVSMRVYGLFRPNSSSRRRISASGGTPHLPYGQFRVHSPQSSSNRMYVPIHRGDVVVLM